LRIHLQPKQDTLYSLLTTTGKESATIIGFGGAKGGGKSAGSDNCALLLAAELGNQYPGLQITIIRRVFNDLKSNHIDKIFEAHPELRDRYTDKDGLKLHNGSRIVFAYAETAGDVERKFRGGFESPFIFVDEAQQFTERELQDMEMAARWTQTSKGLPPGFCKLVLLFNPGGKSSEYLKRIFWTKSYRGKERPTSYAFLHVFGWDNYEWFRGQVEIEETDFYDLDSDARFQLFVTETSEGRKYDAFPDAIRSGYLLGNFDSFEGQYFAGAWDEQLCTLTKAQIEAIVKPWWVRWMAQDWGFGDHASHGWYVSGKLSPSEWVQHFGGTTDYAMDVVIRYREHVIANRPEADMATDVVAMTPQHERREIKRFFMSQDGFGQRAKQMGGHTVGEQWTRIMRRYEMPSPETADQNRVMGWRFMYNLLRQANLRGTNISEERAKQGPAFFVSQECPEAIAAIPAAQRDPDDPDDVERVAGALWEDVTDEIRYGLHSYLNPQSKAPRDIRAKELYDSIQMPDPADQMTARALAMAKFKQQESGIKRVQRMPRWR